MEHELFHLASFDTATSMAFLSIMVGMVFILLILKAKPMPAPAKYASLGMVIAILGLLSWVFYKAQHARVVVTPTAIALDVPLYGVTLSRDRLLLSEAKLINWDDNAAPKLSYRSNGVGLPGYQLGWFRLAESLSGTDKALLSVASAKQVLVLPTKDDYVLILSVTEGQSLLDALQAPPHFVVSD